MFVKIISSGKEKYLYLAQALGTSKEESLYPIGKLSHLQKAFRDPTQFFRDLIKAVKSFQKEKRSQIPIPTNDGPGIIHLGSYFIDYALEQLGVTQILKKIEKENERIYSLDKIVKSYISQKIIDPSSIMGSYKHQNEYVEGFGCALHNVYDSLNLLEKESARIQEAIYKAVLVEDPGRNLNLLLFDGTNYYYESDAPDEDYFDKDGNLVEGLRTKGFSKENRPDPLVGIGLLCTPDGLPLAFIVYPGKKAEQTVLPGFIKRIREVFHLNAFTLVADRGLYSGNIIATVNGPLSNDEKDNYILGMSVRKGSKNFKEWVTDPQNQEFIPIYKDGVQTGALIYKFRVENKKFNYNENGKTKSFWQDQGVLVYNSESYARREKYRRDERVEKIIQALSDGKTYQVLKNPNLKLVQVSHLNSSTGEMADLTRIEIDETKIKRQEILDGHYAITTNELQVKPMVLFSDYHYLLVDERNFKILKSDLKLRPAYVWTPKHIHAYILLSIIALDVLRFLERILDYRFTIEEIIRDLKNFIAVPYFESGFMIPSMTPLISALQEKTETQFEKMFVSSKTLKRIFKLR